MKRLTFREYLDSKETLLKAVRNTPVATVEYVVNKYCSLTIGSSRSDKERVPLKPNNKILIEWEYADLRRPHPLAIRFDGVRNKDPFNDHITYWSGKKLQHWLGRNTRERI